MPRLSVGMARTVDIGFLAPLSGQAESWGLPGLQGCRIWERWLNNAGGVLIGGGVIRSAFTHMTVEKVLTRRARGRRRSCATTTSS